MTKVVVLGAGLVGKEVAKDLTSAFDVTSVDRDADGLERAFQGSAVKTIVADLSVPDSIRQVVAPFDLVVGALPGALGHASLEAVIRAGKDTVDIAFSPEDPFDLDELARFEGVTALVDFGLAPGMSHALLGHHRVSMRRVERYECLVGGLPVVRSWPFQYKAPFSPADVLEEYTRPARYVVDGRPVEVPALSERERVSFEGLGTLEAFNTDGLRTLLRLDDVPNLKEKTLRYPGHAALMEVFRATGLLDETPIRVGDLDVRPRDVTATLLFPLWSFEEGEEDVTVMRVTVEGEKADGTWGEVRWDLHDRYDVEHGVSSMARTTGYPCAAGVHLLATRGYRRPGIVAPEKVGEDGDAFAFLLAYQAERGVDYRRTPPRAHS